MKKAPQNNGLHQTGREGVAFASRRRPVVEARPAGEPGCSTLIEVATNDGDRLAAPTE